jgi:hypothetical protein
MSKLPRSILAPSFTGALLALLVPGSAHADGAVTVVAAPAATPAPAPTPSLYTTPADARPADEQAGRTRFGFGASLTTDSFRAPVAMGATTSAPFDVLGISAFLELGQTENAGVWAPLVRLTGTRAAADTGSGMSTASFTWLTLALDGCPIQATLVAHRVWIRPCARVSGGLLSGSATVDGQALDVHKPWVTAGVLARLQWRPVGPLFFEAQGGAAYAFTHDPVPLGAAVLTPALFEPFGSVGAGLTFP